MNLAAVLLMVAGALLLGALAAAIVLRARVWSVRTPTVRSAERPDGSVALGAYAVGCSPVAIPAQLADWHVRGVVSVRAVEPYLAENSRADISGGPRWRIELGDASGLDVEESTLLAGFFTPDAPRGTVLLLEQDDQDSRDSFATAIRRAQELRATERIRVAGGWAILLRIVAVAAFVLAAVTSAAALTPGGAAAVWIAGLLAMIAVLVLCARPSVPSEQERMFRAQVRGLREFVTTADVDEVDPALRGWAMLWNLPDPWLDGAEQELLDLRYRERVFTRVTNVTDHHVP